MNAGLIIKELCVFTANQNMIWNIKMFETNGLLFLTYCSVLCLRFELHHVNSLTSMKYEIMENVMEFI